MFFCKPPRYNFENFIDRFQEILTIEKEKLIIIGDFNIDLLETSNLDTISYKNIVQMSGFNIANNIDNKHATRFTYNGKPSLIDHVLYNKRLNCSVKVLDDAIGDHRQLSIDVRQNINIFREKINKTIDIIDYNVFYKKFKQGIANKQIESMENLINEIQNAKTQAVRKIIVKFHRGGDWVTSDFLNLLKERNRIYKEKNRNPDN